MIKIVTIAEKRDEKFLREKTRPFKFEGRTAREIGEFIHEMRQSMKEADGVGLSANQIGYSVRVFVAQVPDNNGHMKFYAVFNPDIEKVSPEKILIEEGCLSVPGIFGSVPRPERIVLRGFDRNGKKIKFNAWGLLARVFQHEVDHLDGKLFIDKAKDLHEFVPSAEAKKH